MSATRIIRYRTRADAAQENQRLIEAVFAELARTRPEGLQYTAWRLDDGVTFIHVVDVDGANPLSESPAFAQFQAGIADRCVEGPAPADAQTVGSYSAPSLARPRG